jgi:hypothetical protein
LNDEGFAIPDRAKELLDQYTNDQSYFFAAKLSPDADRDIPLAPVCFRLPGEGPPSYPLRMTALGVPEGETLELTLWIAFPMYNKFTPDMFERSRFLYLPASHKDSYYPVSGLELQDFSF